MTSLPLFAATYLNAAQMSNVTIVLIYCAVLVIVTSMISLKAKDPDPMLAGRNMPWWLVAGSIVGTSVSSIAFLAYPAKGFSGDLSFIGKIVGEFIGLGLAIVFFVKFLRKSRNGSIYTLLADRFGNWAAVYASASFIVCSAIRMGVITCLVSQAIHMICGADIIGVMILSGLMVIFYTYMSGIEGVIWTDLFQTIFFLIAGVASIVFLFHLIPLDNAEIMNRTGDRFALTEGSFWKQTNFSILIGTILFFVMDSFSFYVSNQGTAQRYLVARSDKHAIWGTAIGGLLVPYSIALFGTVGVLLYVFCAGTLPDAVSNASNIFAYFIADRFPDGLKGLAIAGILAAAMSTIDTGINSSSTVLICNLYEPYFPKARNQSLLTMQILRFSSVVFGVAGIFMAYVVYCNGGDILDFFWQSIGAISAGVFGLFLLIRISKTAGPKSAVCALIPGALLAMWITLTHGKAHPLAFPFTYLFAFPVGATTTVLVGLICSRIFKETLPTEPSESVELSEAARKHIADTRRQSKKNVFADSLRPKPFYQVYTGAAVVLGFIAFNESKRIGLTALDTRLLAASLILLVVATIVPFFVTNKTNKRFIFFNLTVLGLVLPFLGALALFSRPESHAFGYFYLVTLGAMGLMVGWTMLGLVSMIATASAAQIACLIFPQVGISDNWPIIAIGALGVLTYYAMQAAKEAIITERTLEKVHTIVEQIHTKVEGISVDLLMRRSPLSMTDIHRLSRAAGDAQIMLSALVGATDINPDQFRLELSVGETIDHVRKRFSAKCQAALKLEGDDDFNVLGNREIFENVIFHVLDNAFYYVERGQAKRVVCHLDAAKKELTISNNGPTVHPDDVPYIFDLGYVSGKEGLGLGLAYCKKMMQGMRGSIRLVSKFKDKWTRFRLYFPGYACLPEEAKMFNIKDAEED